MKSYIYILSALTALLVAILPSSAQTEKAVVTLSANYMREKPDYTAELGTQALMGTVVEVLDSSSYWRLIRTPDGYEAWANEMSLAPWTEDYDSASKFIVLENCSNVYTLPSESSAHVSDLVRGDVLLKGHGRKHGFSAVILPGGRSGWVRTRHLEDYGKWTGSRAASREAVVAEALRYVGVPYLWGGSSPKGFDCSGLSQMAYRMCGMPLPRNASQQAKLGTEVSELLPGDLLFFGRRDEETGKVHVTHVGIYIGNGRMVHASQLVRVNSVTPGLPDSYENLSRFLFARRLLP